MDNVRNTAEKIELGKKKILVFGDIMLDYYEYGTCERKNPEAAAVPILDIMKTEFRLGGAANAAHNIRMLGGQPYLVGVIGNGENASYLLNLLEEKGIAHGIFQDKIRKTTVKRRTYVTSKHHPIQYLLRIDDENKNQIDENVEEEIIKLIDKSGDVNAIVISDYAKGSLTNRIYEHLLIKSRSLGIPFIIDPRPVHTSLYRNATLITPNTEEAEKMVQALTGMVNNGNIAKMGNLLRDRLKSGILITRGSEGMSLFYENSREDIPTIAREAFDVTGAGDTVVAGMAVALAHNIPIKEAAYFANYAAGIAVEKHGTYAVSLEETKEHLKQNS